MIRTISERLRSNSKVLIEKKIKRNFKPPIPLRSEIGIDGKSAIERKNGRKPNTEKSSIIEKCFLDKDPQIKIEPKDFSEEADSTILVRERVRGTKLEGAFKKVKGQIVGQSNHTITVLPSTGKQTVYSKRDVANTVNSPINNEGAIVVNNARTSNSPKATKGNKSKRGQSKASQGPRKGEKEKTKRRN